MSAIKDITGQRFGKLVVLGIGGRTNSGKILWECKCDCGNTTLVQKVHLGKDTNSCGCIRRAVSSARAKKHGETNTRLHNLWCSMNQRCGEHGAESKTYREKGITVCDEWKTYEVFRDWAFSHGYNPNAKRGVTTIDRIDNDKGYSPHNCRFVTQTENARNKSCTIFVTVRGERMALTEAAERFDRNPSLIRARKARGWEDEDAVLLPPRKGRYHYGE